MELVCHIEQGHHQQSFVAGDKNFFLGGSNQILWEDATMCEPHRRPNSDQRIQRSGILQNLLIKRKSIELSRQ